MVKSKFWRGKDLKGMPAQVLTIAEVTEELMGRGTRQDVKAVLWFNETLKGLRLNSSSVSVLEAAYGPDSEGWRGQRIRLKFDPSIMFGGERVGGVVVQTPAGVVWNGATPANGAWGGPAAGGLGSPSAPPQPVWDGTQWVLPQTAPAPAAAPPPPPQPVYNAATGQWELPPQKHVPPLTIGQRVAAHHPPAEDASWSAQAPATQAAPPFDRDTGEVFDERRPPPPADFDDDIPF
jgi:hypothetical protein